MAGDESGKSIGPEQAQVTGHRPRQASDEPIIGGHGKPSRAARRAANRAAREAEAARLWAASNNPPMSLENQSALSQAQVTELPTARQRREEQTQERKSIIGTGQLPRGRPPEYSDQEADAVCCWLQAGGSLKSYSRKTGRSIETLYAWMRENAGFLALVNRASEDRSDTLIDDGLEVVDAAAVNPTIEGVQAAKLQWEARKWVAEKLRPPKWGNRQTVEHVGAVNISIGIPKKPAPLELVEDVQPRMIHGS